MDFIASDIYGNKYYDIQIDNGAQGMNRNDIIVRHFAITDEGNQERRGDFPGYQGYAIGGRGSGSGDSDHGSACRGIIARHDPASGTYRRAQYSCRRAYV
ncbi:MAG: hypothetical protein ACLTLQ_17840 [[Clostridium] scindens]